MLRKEEAPSVIVVDNILYRPISGSAVSQFPEVR